jgi:peptidyl-dipeptidase Dcp
MLKARPFFTLTAACALALLLPAAAPGARENPLLSPSTLPFDAPPFDRITDDDYVPAMQAGMAQQLDEIRAITGNRAAPTFENTVVALEKSGQTLKRTSMVFYAVTQANTDPALQAAQQQLAPLLAAHQDAITLNGNLFALIRAVYEKRARLHLDPESRQLLEVTYRDFSRNGALLDASRKAQLRDINTQLAVLRAEFQRRLLAATKDGALVVSDKAQLAGLPAAQVDAAQRAASARGLTGRWLIQLQNTTQQPALSLLSDRATREALFEASWTRAEKGDANDTRETIATMAQLRAQKARLLGYPDYAAYALTDEMAKTPATVKNFLARLIPQTRVKAGQDAATLQAAIRADGQTFTLAPWDWEYYAQQVRRTKYNLNDDEIRPYFELNDVLQNGLFYAAHQLYGITFKERRDIPVYQPDVRVFEVYDKDGSALALMYFDFYKRDNKAGGAWMSEFVEQSKMLGTKPVVYNVENIPKPAPGQPTLLTFDNVSGIFHEFGHALNGFFSDEKYASLSGANTSRDFVEYPSQFNEHWAMYPAVLKHYAVNYKTGRAMPQELVDRIKRAATFGQSYSLGETLAADELDMAWHSLAAGAPKQDVDAFEAQAINVSHTGFAAIPPRYRSSYFSHIWASGYAAGYYAYMWSEMLDDDTYEWFLQHGGLTRANGQRFRDMILSRGYSEDLRTMFRRFYGRDPDVRPLLRYRGLQ